MIVGCSESDQTPPKVTITSPVSNSLNAITGTIYIQVSASDDSGINKVRVYAREEGSTKAGVYLGEATTAPYVIPWFTANIPNGITAELYAEAVDNTGTVAQSGPVKVKPLNGGLPQLTSFAAYTYPKSPAPQTTGLKQQTEHEVPLTVQVLNAARIQPSGIARPVQHNGSHAVFQKQATRELDHVLQWGWIQMTDPSIAKYYLYTSLEDAVGTYKFVKSVNQQLASSFAPQATLGIQTGSQYIDRIIDVELTEKQPFYGMVTGATANRAETGLSNAMSTNFLLDQPINTTPSDGATVANGKPNLSWNELKGADEYLFFVYDKDPSDTRLKPVLKWGSQNIPTPYTLVNYPSNQAPLPTGEYYWWVAGVKFAPDDRALAFSFSTPTRFVVP